MKIIIGSRNKQKEWINIWTYRSCIEWGNKQTNKLKTTQDGYEITERQLRQTCFIFNINTH